MSNRGRGIFQKFKSIFFPNKNKGDSFQPINLITGGHLKITKDFVNRYSHLKGSKNASLNKLIVMTNDPDLDNELNNTQTETVEVYTKYNLKEKESIDELTNYLKEKNYKINNILHIDHLVPLSFVSSNSSKTNDHINEKTENESDSDLETASLDFSEIKRVSQVNIDNPLILNSVLLSRPELLMQDKTNIFHLFPQKPFNIEKYYKPNKMFSNLFLNLSMRFNKTITEKNIYFGLLELRTIEKEYSSLLKSLYLEEDSHEGMIREEDLKELKEKVLMYEEFYDEALNLLVYVCSSEFGEWRKENCVPEKQGNSNSKNYLDVKQFRKK
mmetsp:Transcript_21256/g.22041  ORF Transcript_21256/g.22041 Transcript_21256/m.22041 type:complete len:328 (+) Transcript_21256:7-990(+)